MPLNFLSCLLLSQRRLVCLPLAVVCKPTNQQVSSISGSDTSDLSSDSDISEDEAAAAAGGGTGGSSSRRSGKGQRGSAAVLQGAQVVFKTTGGLDAGGGGL